MYIYNYKKNKMKKISKQSALKLSSLALILALLVGAVFMGGKAILRSEDPTNVDPGLTAPGSMLENTTIDYSPANDSDNAFTDSQKAATNPNSPNNSTDDSRIGVVLTAAAQDYAGGPLVIRVLVSGISSGNCLIRLTNTTISLEYSKKVINSGTYFSCEPLDIPFVDLGAGTWDLEVTVADNSHSANAKQQVNLTQ